MNSIIGKDLILNGQKLRVLDEQTSSGQYKTTSPELQARLARVNGESLAWSNFEAIYLNNLLIPRTSFNYISENNTNVDLGEIPVILKVKQGHRRKLIFIIGGVVSSIGKGIIASSLGMLLEARNYRIQLQKFDPYLNVDPGTMSPHQHGEVYVLEDGTEVDLDFGHYSRFTNCRFGKEHSVTSGKVYENVINRERKGDYLGATVQIVPHLIDEIKTRMALPQAEIIINEIGGCVGDIEAMPYLEAIRQFQQEKDYDVLVLLVSYLVNIKAAGEIKTKPTQHCVAKLKEAGVCPNFILCRHESGIDIAPDIFKKLSRFCDVKLSNVIPVADCQTIYEVPLKLYDWQLDNNILTMLGCERRRSNIKQWVDMVYNIRHVQGYDSIVRCRTGVDGEVQKQVEGPLHDDIKTVNILMVGKYLENRDSYISVLEALKHAGYHHKFRVNDIVIDAEKTMDQKIDIKQFLDQNKIGGILVPGGYGKRGTEGIIQFIQFARENNIPLFGICLGMQLSVIEYSRHVLGLPDATSEEFDPQHESKNHVIFMMKETQGAKGASQRLGSQEVDLAEGSYISKIYNANLINERYRHRYVVNPQYFDSLQMNGAFLAGRCPISNFPQTMELPNNKFFIAVQYHPEYKSKPLKPQPIFCEFVLKSLQHQEEHYPGSTVTSEECYSKPHAQLPQSSKGKGNIVPQK